MMNANLRPLVQRGVAEPGPRPLVWRLLDGQPLDFHLTGGEASDGRELETSLDIGPGICPRIAVTDNGCDSAANRAAARARGITPIIPRRENSKERGRFFACALILVKSVDTA